MTGAGEEATLEADPPDTGSLPTRSIPARPLPTRRSLRTGQLDLGPSIGSGVGSGVGSSATTTTQARTGRKVGIRAGVKLAALAAVVGVGVLAVLQVQPSGPQAQTFLAARPSSAAASPEPASPTSTPTSPSGPAGSPAATGSPSTSGGTGSSGSVGASGTATRAAGRSGAPSSRPGNVTVASARKTYPGGTTAVRMYGEPASGLPWHSGFWMGGSMSPGNLAAAGAWRGRTMDFATCYPAYQTWSALTDQSTCIGLMSGYPGRLALGLPMLPQDRRGQWDDILSGAHDDVFRTVARQLQQYGFGDSAVRVGLEANGDWFPWGVTADTAPQYKAAFRRIVSVMRSQAPQLSFWFDISASANPLAGTSGRADVFDVMYPGDDVVDGIAMDHYDFYSLVAKTDEQFAAAIRPANGFGLQDAADFARKRGKGFAVPEWGVHTTQGAGDNPFFIEKMFGFFQANRDILVFEDYFNEGADYIGAAIWNPAQNPQSAAAYQRLWGGR